jgi:hypothetical protein
MSAMTFFLARRSHHDNDQDRPRLTGRYSKLDIILLEFLNSARMNHLVLRD